MILMRGFVRDWYLGIALIISHMLAVILGLLLPLSHKHSLFLVIYGSVVLVGAVIFIGLYNSIGPIPYDEMEGY